MSLHKSSEGSSKEINRLIECPLLATRIEVDPTAWVAPGAVLAGEITVGKGSSIWFGCVLRGDLQPIRIGEETNIQDLTTVHVDYKLPAILGDRITVGHRCVIHGCEIADDVLIGIGAVVLSGARIGRGALVAAGAVVLEDSVIPENSFVTGVPAKVRGEVTPEMRERIRVATASYVSHLEYYRDGRVTIETGHGSGPAPSKEREP
jgi:carbonic anhydrase/acetyltransferase-like protein (isoleucine patch superfamily)